MLSRSPLLILLAVLASLTCGCMERSARVRLRFATTTSTENSGLLAHLLPPFEEAENVDVQVVAVGTGMALAIARNGDADLVLVHAREMEEAFVSDGHASERRDVMWNDFVVLGPDEDPAGVREATGAVDAFRRIHAANAAFVTRGDESGTHMREQSIWDRAGCDPNSLESYFDAGQGMGACLTIADEKSAYILADRGTWLALKRPALHGVQLFFLRYAVFVPTVIVGLFVYALLSRRGPLGGLDLLYTQEAVIFGEFLLAFPILGTFAHVAATSDDGRRAFEASRTLGASPLRAMITVMSESRLALLSAWLVAVARCYAELGVVTTVGGNLRGETRTLSSTIQLELKRGDFAKGVACGVILLSLALTFSVAGDVLSKRRKK